MKLIGRSLISICIIAFFFGSCGEVGCRSHHNKKEETETLKSNLLRLQVSSPFCSPSKMKISQAENWCQGHVWAQAISDTRDFWIFFHRLLGRCWDSLLEDMMRRRLRCHERQLQVIDVMVLYDMLSGRQSFTPEGPL